VWSGPLRWRFRQDFFPLLVTEKNQNSAVNRLWRQNNIASKVLIKEQNVRIDVVDRLIPKKIFLVGKFSRTKRNTSTAKVAFLIIQLK